VNGGDYGAVGGSGGKYPVTTPPRVDYGEGSNGSGGAYGGGTGDTNAGENGFTQATFYYVEMT
jgi:hypothetical protein